MDSDNEASEAEQWKRRYFEHLTETERKDAEYRQADELLRKAVSRLAVAADGQDDDLDRELRGLRNAIRDGNNSQSLESMIDSMSAALVRLDQKRGGGSEQRAEPSGGGLLDSLFGGRKKTSQRSSAGAGPANRSGNELVRETLIHLLERLQVPDQLVERVSAIRARIERSTAQDAWDSVVEQIADLIRSLGGRTQKDARGMEEFLLQLGDSLQEVCRRLAGSQQHYDDSFTAAQQLDSTVIRDIGDMQAGMRDSSDLAELKRLVQTHVDTVMEHMEQHRVAEQERYRQASTEMSAMDERLRELDAEASTLRSRLRDAYREAHMDVLTGIPNRLAYEERLTQEIARWKRFATPLVLAVWDIDLFKQVNDRFGHKAGDKVLRTIAQTLAGSIRETDFIARYGGEEFAQLMTGAELQDCLLVADRLRAAVEASGFHFRGDAVTVTVSCGLAQFRDGDSSESWFERADKALYRAKAAGRNRCEIAS